MQSVLEIWDIAAGAARNVLRTKRHIEAPNWAPDGSHLLVNGEGRLFRVPLDAPGLVPDLMPDLVPVPTPDDLRLNNDHGISPDGKWIVVSGHRGQGSEMYRMPAGGGALQKISPEAPSWWHGWSPDGATLTYVAARGGSRIIDVYMMPFAGGPEVRLTQGQGHHDGPDYAHDGRHIFYNCDRDGHAQIWVMGADGADQRKLFADAHVNWFPHPSPCGRHLVYLAYPPGTLGHPALLPVALVLCRPDGTGRRRIVEFTGGQGSINVPSWAPDGTAFAFVRYEV